MSRASLATSSRAAEQIRTGVDELIAENDRLVTENLKLAAVIGGLEDEIFDLNEKIAELQAIAERAHT